MASPFFFVSKRDTGKLWPCQDYWYLNEWTIKNAYPLLLMSKINDKLKGARYFTKLDIQWGYNNIWIKKGDEWKAVFKTNRGLYKPMVMFFGMCNSPATFQAMMDSMRTLFSPTDSWWNPLESTGFHLEYQTLELADAPAKSNLTQSSGFHLESRPVQIFQLEWLESTETHQIMTKFLIFKHYLITKQLDYNIGNVLLSSKSCILFSSRGDHVTTCDVQKVILTTTNHSTTSPPHHITTTTMTTLSSRHPHYDADDSDVSSPPPHLATSPPSRPWQRWRHLIIVTTPPHAPQRQQQQQHHRHHITTTTTTTMTYHHHHTLPLHHHHNHNQMNDDDEWWWWCRDGVGQMTTTA